MPIRKNPNKLATGHVQQYLETTNLDRFVLQTKTVERVYRLLSILRPVIVNKTVT